MDRLTSRNKIEPFIELSSCHDDYREDGIPDFQRVFYRELGSGARPIAENEDVVALPADGRHLAIPDLSKVERIYAKGQSRFAGIAWKWSRQSGLRADPW